MFKNFLKIAFRNIVRYKGYSLLIIEGLAVGMGLFILTALYAEHEFSFDSFHKNADRVYSLIEKYPEGVYGGRHTGMIPGNPKTALFEPLSIVLIESMAHKYFGNKKPVGLKIKESKKFMYDYCKVIANSIENILKVD